MKVFLAIPAYNCEKQITRVLADIENCPKLLEQVDVIAVFDNCSSDGTVGAASEFAKKSSLNSKLEIYRNLKNCGLGGTHKIAFSMAKERGCSNVLLIHGDHQAAPKEALNFLEVAKMHPNQQVLGSRFQRLSLLKGYSAVRTAGNIALNAFYSLITNRNISDLGSGLNFFDLTEFALSEVYSFDDFFNFNMDLLLWLISRDRQFLYVPISWTSEDEISNAKILSVGYRTLTRGLRWFFCDEKFAPSDLFHQTKRII